MVYVSVYMLTKRTNILFSPAQWKKIQKLAKKNNLTAGGLIRKAVDQLERTEEDRGTIIKAHEDILKYRKKTER